MKKQQPKLTVERKELPTTALWAGAIIAPLLCLTSVLELAVGADKMSLLSIAWTVFVAAFTAFYSVDFARQLRIRLHQERSKTKKKAKK